MGRKHQIYRSDRWCLDKRLTTKLGVALSTLVCVSVLSELHFLLTMKTEAWVEHSHFVLEKNDEVLTLIKDAETGQRGYILTNDERYLQPYRIAIARTDRAIKQLRQLTLDNPQQQRRLDALEPLVVALLADLKQTIILRRKGIAAALQVIKNNRGHYLMEEIRKLSGEIATAENQLLSKRKQQAQATAQTLHILIVLSSIIGVVFLILSSIKLNRELQNRQSAQAERKQALEDLEVKRNLLEAVIEQLPSGVVVAEVPSGKLILANKQVSQIWRHPVIQSEEEHLDWQSFHLDGQPYQPSELPLARSIRTGEVVSDEQINFRRGDGTCGTMSVSSTPVCDSDGRMIAGVMTFSDITEHYQADEALRTSESRLKLALESAHMVIWEWNILTNQITWSDQNELLFGLTPGTFKGTSVAFLEVVHPEDRAMILQTIERCVNEKVDYDKEFRIVWSDGSIHWLLAKGKTFFDETGKPVRMIGINIDITSQKQAAEQIEASLREKEVLLKEIHHRVKNNLQIISSLLNLQSGYIEDEKTLEFLQAGENRVLSMALVHELLYQSKDLAKIDFAAYIEDLASNLFSSYNINPDAIALNINVNKISLGVDTAIPCGLIINELISNALKYAFPSGRSGEITINSSTEPQQIILTIRDDGVGFSDNFDWQNTDSLGLQIVTALTNQLQGNLELNRDNGTEFKLKFPI